MSVKVVPEGTHPCDGAEHGREALAAALGTEDRIERALVDGHVERLVLERRQRSGVLHRPCSHHQRTTHIYTARTTYTRAWDIAAASSESPSVKNQCSPLAGSPVRT